MAKQGLRIVPSEKDGLLMYGLHEVDYDDEGNVIGMNERPLTTSTTRGFDEFKDDLIEAYARADFDPSTLPGKVPDNVISTGLYGEVRTKVSPEEDRITALQDKINSEAWNYYELRKSIKPPFEVIVASEDGNPMARRTLHPTLKAYYEAAARFYASGWDYQLVETLSSDPRNMYRIVLTQRR